MPDSAVSPVTIDGFLRRWEASGAAERANDSMFLGELCDLLEVHPPDPAGPDNERNAYVFEEAERGHSLSAPGWSIWVEPPHLHLALRRLRCLRSKA